MKKQEYAVATGNKYTTEAGKEILEKGGNAFDAILACLWTATVTEPTLVSLGGGGFCLAKAKNKEAELFDFFTQTPKSNKFQGPEVNFYPVDVDFGGATQEFHIGLGAVATPGVVAGIFAIHKEYASLPMEEIVKPAVRFAREGCVLGKFQAFLFQFLYPIMTATDEMEKTFSRVNGLAREGEKITNQALANTIEQLAKRGERKFYQGEIGEKIVSLMSDGGYLTKKDLESYEVKKRKPLVINYRGNKIITNPTPSAGGTLIAFALKLLENIDLSRVGYASGEYISVLAEVMRQTQLARRDKLDKNLYEKNIAKRFLSLDYLQQFINDLQTTVNRLGGTTHMSVVDGEGNVASLTASNGEGSGYMIPETGIVLNNMLGEEDLNPKGFHNWETDRRMSSMMAPSILETADHLMVLGSAGSNRIRSAILQTIIRVLDYNFDLERAVNDFRLHFENNRLDIEPLPKKFDDDTIKMLKGNFGEVNFWDEQSLFFGGANCVAKNLQTGKCQAGGDVRREGVGIVDKE